MDKVKNNVLAEEYRLRFEHAITYRNEVWQILSRFFQSWIPTTATILDLGAGYGEFINNIKASNKYALDLNPDVIKYLSSDVTFINQDCSVKWALPGDNEFDVVFTSNFLEHLQTKVQAQETVKQVYDNLKPGGIFILLGPNIKYVEGKYWDFWDHHLPFTDKSLVELLRIYNFEIVKCIPKFLPYSMSDSCRPPLMFVLLYLKLPFLWKLLGKQFLIVAKKKFYD